MKARLGKFEEMERNHTWVDYRIDSKLSELKNELCLDIRNHENRLYDCEQ